MKDQPAMRIAVATMRQADEIAAIYGPIVSHTAISFELDPPSTEEIAHRMEGTLKRFPWLVALDAENRVAGYAYAHLWRERAAYAWVAETSAYVGVHHRGRGIASALYSALLEILRRQGYRRAVAGITLPNPASVRLHESVGFESVGQFSRVGWKHGRWHDVGWWQKEIGTGEGPPAELVPFPELELGADLIR